MTILKGATVAAHPFLMNEMRITCQLHCDGMDDSDIVSKVKSENLFQYPTERKLAAIARACCKRANAADSDAIVRIIASGMPDAAAQANMYAMMCTYPLVRHFMMQIVSVKYADLDYTLAPMDVGAYVTNLQAEYDNIAQLSDSTIVKLKQVLRRCLVECGMIENTKSDHLVPIMMDPTVRYAIEAKGDMEALRAFNYQEMM